MTPQLSRGLAVAGAGYLLAIAANLTPGNLDVAAHLALAGAGALLAAWALAAPAPAFLAAGFAALALARAWSATRGTLLQNWPFALPAWVVAAGLAIAALAALAHARGAVLDHIRVRRGLAVAALGAGLVAVWMVSTGAIDAGFAGTLMAAAGFAIAALDAAAEPALRPVHAGVR